MGKSDTILAGLADLVASEPEESDPEADMARPTDRSRAAATPTTSRYFFEAVPAREGGFTARYGIPGLLATRLKDDAGDVAVFSSQEAAELAAADAMASVLNSRAERMSVAGDGSARPLTRHSYDKMSGSDLAMALETIGLSPTRLAFLYGTKPSRVLEWIEGRDNVPHPLRVLISLFLADPANIEVAEAVAHEAKAIADERQAERREVRRDR